MTKLKTLPSDYDIQIRSFKYSGVPAAYRIDEMNHAIRHKKIQRDRHERLESRKGCKVFNYRDHKANDFTKIKMQIIEG